MKILNLFAGIGGNRLLWDNVLHGVKVTAVEFDPEIAKAYAKRYPNDNVIVGDAWDYAAKNYLDFDFILASPPCQTHSRLNIAKYLLNSIFLIIFISLFVRFLNLPFSIFSPLLFWL